MITFYFARLPVRVRYVKVAEYQARGVIRLHAIIRLDAAGDDYQPPPAGCGREMLDDQSADSEGPR